MFVFAIAIRRHFHCQHINIVAIVTMAEPSGLDISGYHRATVLKERSTRTCMCKGEEPPALPATWHLLSGTRHVPARLILCYHQAACVAASPALFRRVRRRLSSWPVRPILMVLPFRVCETAIFHQ